MNVIDRMNIVPRMLIDSYVISANTSEELYNSVCMIADHEGIADDKTFTYMHMIIEDYWRENNGNVFSVYFDE